MQSVSDNNRLLLLMSPSTYRAEAFLEAAGRLGIEVVKGLDLDAELAVGWKGALGLDFRDVEGSVARIVEFAGKQPLRAILSVDDRGSVLAAAAAAALGLPHNAPEAALAAR